MTTTGSRAANRQSPALATPPQSLPAAEVRRQRIALAREMLTLLLRDGLPADICPLALAASKAVEALARAVREIH